MVYVKANGASLGLNNNSHACTKEGHPPGTLLNMEAWEPDSPRPGESVGCCNSFSPDMLFDKILTRCSTPPTHLQSQYL